MNKKFIVVAVAFAFASCNQPAGKQTARQDILRSNLDTTVKPGDDFFAYANGGWLKSNAIPADETIWGIGEFVQHELYKRLHSINEDAL